MDYETFGEHQWPETGIFDFLRALPKSVFNIPIINLIHLHELTKMMQPVSPFMSLILFHGLTKKET